MPPRVPVRPGAGRAAAIIFGDASGTGFGTLLWIYKSSSVSTEYGVLTTEYSEKSLNFWELYNLVRRLKNLISSGVLGKGTEVFIFTDNSVLIIT